MDNRDRTGFTLVELLVVITIIRIFDCALAARVPIDDPDGLIRLGIRGQTRIYTAWIPLGTRLWRLVAHTFNFKL